MLKSPAECGRLGNYDLLLNLKDFEPQYSHKKREYIPFYKKVRSSWGGDMGGLGRAIAPSEHASPRRKVKSEFFGDFWHSMYPENHILAPSLEESAPRRKIPGATPAF